MPKGVYKRTEAFKKKMSKIQKRIKNSSRVIVDININVRRAK